LSKYNAREFNEVEIIGDEKLVGKKEISTTFLIKSATLGGDIYEKKIETYVSHKPKTTPITDLGIKPDTGSGAMKLVINNQETGIVSKLLLDILPSIAIFVLFIFLLTKFGPK